MSDAVAPDTPLRGRHNAIALEAVRRLPMLALERVVNLHDRQLRCLRPRPGGAADSAMSTIKLDADLRVSISKDRMANGGDISIVVGVWHATLARDVLRLFDAGLPHTVLATLPGRLMGELAQLDGILSPLKDVRIEEVSEDGNITALVLDLPHVSITRGDVCRYALEAERNRRTGP